ncbi:MAG: hypothetical protein GX371_07360 [Bacteroidales bacterium]|nr:hypothetical protein [Bacteroidales bacterium]
MRSIKDLFYRLSGILILLSALLYLFAPVIAPWIMAFSVALFTVLTITTPYPGKSIRGKRLYNFQILTCLLMIVATYLMFQHRNEWALAMIVGALFLLYSSIMIPKVLEEERRR